MINKSLLTLFLVLYFFTGQAQTKNSLFKLSIVNYSKFTTTCTILGNDKTDSVSGKDAKIIVFDLDKDQPSFYLNIWTADPATSSYRNKLIRILNVQGSKDIIINEKNQINYSLTPSERTIADYNPRLRTKNFWKLDSVIKANANDIAAADIIFLSLCDIDVKVDTIKKYYNLLTPAIKATAFGDRITNYLVARSRLDIGNKMDNFSLPDTVGRAISLYQIKSDYILLDFWFSRCGPCIKSFPELQGLYAKTKRKKFEIIGISIDQSGEAELWKNTIKKHNLSWVNINDPKSKTVQKFAVVNYPTKILLDKDKRIVLVDTENNYENFYREVEKLVNGK